MAFPIYEPHDNVPIAIPPISIICDGDRQDFGFNWNMDLTEYGTRK